MKIGLLDVDNLTKKTKFPNLALMKLSAYHKSIGDHVEWYNTMSFIDPYDIVYKAKVFDFSKEPDFYIYATKVIEGGVAYGIENKLIEVAEHMMPDYSIYDFKEAYGFLTRGCPRNCNFCNVSEHQGKKSIKVADLSEFWTGQKEIKLLDPNMFACKEWRTIAQQLINSKAYIDFTQGIDIRLMDDEKIEMVNQMKIKMIHFAWDQYDMKTFEKLKEFRSKLNFRGRDLRVYVLTNFDTTEAEDLDRIYKLRELDYDPYVMIYDKKNSSKRNKQLARWVNSKPIWRTCNSFDDYLAK